jgi:hypothetical protein
MKQGMKLSDIVAGQIYGHCGYNSVEPVEIFCTREPGWLRGYVDLKYDAAIHRCPITRAYGKSLITNQDVFLPIKRDWQNSCFRFERLIVLPAFELSPRRQEFEIWMRSRHKHSLARSKKNFHEYADSPTQQLWELWEEKVIA